MEKKSLKKEGKKGPFAWSQQSVKNEWTLIFILALLVGILSLAQLVQTAKVLGELGPFGFVQLVIFGLIFLAMMFLLIFGMYASEDHRGKVVKRVKLFDRWLSKEKK